MGKKMLEKKRKTQMAQTKTKILLASMMMNKFKQSVSLYVLLWGESKEQSS